jgi:hypothetical protein
MTGRHNHAIVPLYVLCAVALVSSIWDPQRALITAVVAVALSLIRIPYNCDCDARKVRS